METRNEYEVCESTIINDKQGVNIKDLGQVFTPNYIVDLILNEVGYFKEQISTYPERIPINVEPLKGKTSFQIAKNL
jgi:hypothetical protein